MRPLRYSINVTLDGCCDHRAISSDEDMHRHAAENLAQADALLFGRWAHVWCTSVRSLAYPTATMKGWEYTMDLITGVNLAFVHEQVRVWTRAATARPVAQRAKETLLGRIGDHLIAAGIWLKMRPTPLPTPQELQSWVHGRQS